MRQVERGQGRRNHRRAVAVAAVLTAGVAFAPVPALAGPAGPYVDKYGQEICDALNSNPTHDEVLRAIVAVRTYNHLSDEDAEIVVVDSISRICPQYRNLIEPPGSNQPPPQPWG